MAAGVLIFVLASLSWMAESRYLSDTGFQQSIPNPVSCGCPSANQFLVAPGPIVSNCGIQGPSIVSNGPICGLNNFAGPLSSQVTETITTQVPSILGNQFVSETFLTPNPYQSCSSLSQIGLPTSLLNIRTVDDDEYLSTTLANALELLILSNLIENLNEAGSLGALTSYVVENAPQYKDFVTSIAPIVTGCSNIPPLVPYSSSIGPLSSNLLEAPCQASCNTRLRESINPIRVPPLGTFGGVPEIVNSKISCCAPHIPDVINPTNFKLVEAINSHLPFGPLPSCNRNFAEINNPVHLPSLIQPSVLPEIGNPVNLPEFGSLFSKKVENNPFRVQSISPLGPPSGIVAHSYNVLDGSLQVREPFNYNQFNGHLLPDASNYNRPFHPDFSYQFYEPSNPLVALLKQLPEEKANAFITPYGSPGIYSEQNPFGEVCQSFSTISNQQGSSYPVSTTAAFLESSLNLPPLIQSTVFPEIGHPVNLPECGCHFPENLEGNSFRVQSFSPLAPPPGIVAHSYNVYDGPLQVHEPFNNNQFYEHLLPDAYNYNRPFLPDFSYQFNDPTNPLITLLKQLLEEKSNAFLTSYVPPDTHNPYLAHGPCSEQNPFGEVYQSFPITSNHESSSYPVSPKSALIESLFSQIPYGALMAELLIPSSLPAKLAVSLQ